MQSLDPPERKLNKEITMKKLHRFALTALLAAMSTTAISPAIGAPPKKKASQAQAKVLTPAAINAILVSVDQAANRMDVEAISAPLAANFSGKIDLQGMGSYTFNRAQYKSHLLEGFKVMKNYRYKRSNTKISITKDGQSARVTATIQETMEINGMPLRGQTQETSTFKILGNRIQITSIHGVGTLAR